MTFIVSALNLAAVFSVAVWILTRHKVAAMSAAALFVLQFAGVAAGGQFSAASLAGNAVALLAVAAVAAWTGRDHADDSQG